MAGTSFLSCVLFVAPETLIGTLQTIAQIAGDLQTADTRNHAD